MRMRPRIRKNSASAISIPAIAHTPQFDSGPLRTARQLSPCDCTSTPAFLSGIDTVPRTPPRTARQ